MLVSELTRPGVQTNTSDDNLIAAAKSGDVEAFGALFKMYRDPVYTFVVRSMTSREDAEDIVQEVFCRAWKSIRFFRGESKFLTWLYRIAANLCADYARSARRKANSLSKAGMELQNSRDSHSSDDYEDLRSGVVYEALRSLPVNHRILVVLCDVYEFTDTEAARVLGCSPVSARVRLSRARKKLRNLLSEVLNEVE